MGRGRGDLTAARRQTVRLGALHLTVWGEPSAQVLVTVHGKHSHQMDADITAARVHAVRRGAQVVTWDLPGHGTRPGTPAQCRITDAAAELAHIRSWTGHNFEDERVFATSMGAYLTLVTGHQERLCEASFLSPVIDMAALLHQLMGALSVTPERLRELGRIDTPVETLEWSQYEFISAHPVRPWRVPTRILRGAHDDLVPAASIEIFCARSGAQLTTAPDAAHYFHTPSDLSALESWLAG